MVFHFELAKNKSNKRTQSLDSTHHGVTEPNPIQPNPWMDPAMSIFAAECVYLAGEDANVFIERVERADITGRQSSRSSSPASPAPAAAPAAADAGGGGAGHGG